MVHGAWCMLHLLRKKLKALMQIRMDCNRWITRCLGQRTQRHHYIRMNCYNCRFERYNLQQIERRVFKIILHLT